jgi:hypothetical protein
MNCFGPGAGNRSSKNRHRRSEEERYAPRISKSQNGLGTTTTTISCKVPPHIYNPPNTAAVKAWECFQSGLNSNLNINTNAFNLNSQLGDGFGGENGNGNRNGNGVTRLTSGSIHEGMNGISLSNIEYGSGLATYVPIREQVYGRRPSSLIRDVEGIRKLQTRLEEAIIHNNTHISPTTNKSTASESAMPTTTITTTTTITAEDVSATVSAALKEDREAREREKTKADLEKVIEQQRQNSVEIGTLKLERQIDAVRSETRKEVLKEIQIGIAKSSERERERERSRERRNREEKHHLEQMHLNLLSVAADKKRQEEHHIHYHAPSPSLIPPPANAAPTAPAPVIIPHFGAAADHSHASYTHPQPYTYASPPPLAAAAANPYYQNPYQVTHPHQPPNPHPYGNTYPPYPDHHHHHYRRRSSLVDITVHEVKKLVGRLGRVEDAVLGSELLTREREGRLGLRWRDERGDNRDGRWGWDRV